MELTAEQKKKYLETGGIKCPFCGSAKFDGLEDFWTLEGVLFKWKTECRECKATWTEVYTLTGIEDAT